MVVEQRLPVEIVPMPIVREPDGLAMSSRNVYLSKEGRSLALRLSQSLRLAERMVMQDGATDAETVRRTVEEYFESPLSAHPEEPAGRGTRPEGVSKGERRTDLIPAVALDYVSVSDERTLEELETIDRPALILIAARIGKTRLIDNTIVVPKGMPAPADLRSLMEE
jgi:pantoate--beta-alanine ligase